MAATKYTYSIANDFPNNIVESTALSSEITSSTVTRVLDYINTSGDDCDIWFLDTLTSGDIITLSGVVAAHDGTALLSTAIAVKLSEEYRDRSGKLRIQETSRPLNTTTYFTGAGDDTTDVTDVGGGQSLNFYHTVSGSTTEILYIDFNIIENETWIHEVHISWEGTHHDEIIFELVPRTVSYTISSGTSYNIYGGYLVTPAAGDGTINITSDLTTHSGGLVYMADDDLGITPTAYWNADWNTTTKQFENITAAPLGDGRYNLFTVEVILVRYINKMHISGTSAMVMQASDADQIGHGVRFKITANTDINDPFGDHDWSASAIITMYRKKTI